MNDTQFYRDDALARARADGFDKMDLVEAHTTIALMVGRHFARRTASPRDADLADAMACVAALHYEGGTPSMTLVGAIARLFETPDGCAVLRDIGRLLGHFAAFTRTTPAGHTHAAWVNEITDISVDLSLGLVEDGGDVRCVDRERVAIATNRFINILHHLWD